jgi:serine/threonine-protein kinase
LNRLGYPAGSTSCVVAKALWRSLVVAEGAGAAEVFLRECGVETGELEDETSAMPLGNLHRLLRRFVERRGRAALRDLSRAFLEPELLAAWVPVLRGVEAPGEAMARVGSAESDQRRTLRWEVVESGAQHWVGRLVFQHDPDLEQDGLLAEARAAMLRAVPHFFGLPIGESVAIGPIEKGEVCTQVYRVSWGAGGASIGLTAAMGFGGGALVGALAPLGLGPSGLAFGALGVAATLGAGAGAFLARERGVRARGTGESLRRRALERKIALEETRAKQGSAGLEGQLLAGAYRVRKRMGSGASGVVYEATRTSDSRPVAMKLLLASAAHDSVASDRLRREAEALGLAWHPNVVEVLDQGQLPDGTIYLVMELLKGDSLAHRLRRDGPFSPHELTPIAIELAGALEAIHAAGVIHRDLKPENVFLVATPEGGTRPKILDFGIARVEWAETRITVNGVPMGTPGYMAPEQERGGEVDARADIFAFGAMLFECLTGEPPAPLTASHLFVASTAADGGGSWENLSWPREPAVIEGWKRVVERAMAAEPEQRFQDAREMLDALRAIELPIPEAEFPM